MSKKCGWRHGTISGNTAHINMGEVPCEACRIAKAEYDKRRLQAPEQTRRNRLKAKAQGRARGYLVAMYPEVYKELYEQAKAELMEELD